jgi:drug/metabolite transporter (DMT)-like permease
MKTALYLLAIGLLTLAGDYVLKSATLPTSTMRMGLVLAGAVFYGATAFGWYALMQQHTLASIGIYFSATTLLMLALLGYFVFDETLDLRAMTGITLAIASMLIMAQRTGG